MLRVVVFAVLTLLAACGSRHPLAGHWQEQVAAGTVGLELWFDGNEAVGGCNHQPDDDDIDGRFTFADGKLTITGRWKNSGKPVALSGQLVGDRLELTGAGGMTILRRGSAPGAARH